MPEAEELWRVERALGELVARRDSILRAMHAASARAGRAAALGWSSQAGGAAGWDGSAGSGGASPAAGREVPRVGVRNVLLGLGAVTLGVAAVVFAALSWDLLGLVGRALVLLAWTGGALGAGWALSRRGLVATADAVAAVGLVLAVLLAWLAWVADIGGLKGLPGLWYSAGATAVLAALWAGYARVAAVRSAAPTAVALAQLPVPFALLALDVPARTSVLVLVGLSLADLALRRATSGRTRRAAAVAGAVAGTVAALGAFGGVLAPLAGVPTDPGGAFGWAAAPVLLAVGLGAAAWSAATQRRPADATDGATPAVPSNGETADAPGTAAAKGEAANAASEEDTTACGDAAERRVVSATGAAGGEGAEGAPGWGGAGARRAAGAGVGVVQRGAAASAGASVVAAGALVAGVLGRWVSGRLSGAFSGAFSDGVAGWFASWGLVLVATAVVGGVVWLAAGRFGVRDRRAVLAAGALGAAVFLPAASEWMCARVVLVAVALAWFARGRTRADGAAEGRFGAGRLDAGRSGVGGFGAGRFGVGGFGPGRSGPGQSGAGRLGAGRSGVGRLGAGRSGVGRLGAGRSGVGRSGVGRLGGCWFRANWFRGVRKPFAIGGLAVMVVALPELFVCLVLYAGNPLSILARGVWTGSGDDEPTVLQPGALVCVVVAGALLRRPVLAAPAATFAVLLLPVTAVGPFIAVAGAAGFAGWAASGWGAERSRIWDVRASAGSCAVVLGVWAAVDSLTSESLTVAVLAALTVIAAVAALSAPLRSGAVAVGVLAAGGCAAAGALAAGLPATGAAFAVLAVAAGGAAVARFGGVPADAAVGVLGACGVAMAVQEPGALSAALAVAGAVAYGTALRRERRPAAYVGAVLLAAAWWVRLAAWHTGTVEAYTAPIAVALLVVGWARWSRTAASSWEAYGPGLGMLLLPSLIASFVQSGVLRPALLAAGAALVVLAGARLRLQAPLAIGGAMLLLVGVRELAPYAAGLPRWCPIAAAGLALVVVGATYERRLNDVRRARAAFARLR